MLNYSKVILAILTAVLVSGVIIFVFPGTYIIPKRAFGYHLRKFAPPSKDQIQQMEEKRDLCFVDADCVASDVSYKVGTNDCNFSSKTNNYYCNVHECPMTLMACLGYDIGDNVCVENTCTFKTVKTVKSNY